MREDDVRDQSRRLFRCSLTRTCRKVNDNVSENDIQEIQLLPGMELVIEPESPLTCFELFAMIVFTASAYRGDLVVGQSFLPGMDLCAHSQWVLTEDLGPIERAWAQAQAGVDGWLDQFPEQGEYVLSINGLDLRFVMGDTPPSGIITFRRQWMRTG